MWWTEGAGYGLWPSDPHTGPQIYAHFLVAVDNMLEAVDDPVADLLKAVPPSGSSILFAHLPQEEQERLTAQAAPEVLAARFASP